MRTKSPPTEPLSARERRVLLIAGVVVAVLLAAGLGSWALLDRGPDYSRSGNGCVAVESASSMGGSVQRACGDRARDWCRAETDHPNAAAAAVLRQCRLAGILP
jgi:hypothetical protein